MNKENTFGTTVLNINMDKENILDIIISNIKISKYIEYDAMLLLSFIKNNSFIKNKNYCAKILNSFFIYFEHIYNQITNTKQSNSKIDFIYKNCIERQIKKKCTK